MHGNYGCTLRLYFSCIFLFSQGNDTINFLLFVGWTSCTGRLRRRTWTTYLWNNQKKELNI